MVLSRLAVVLITVLLSQCGLHAAPTSHAELQVENGLLDSASSSSSIDHDGLSKRDTKFWNQATAPFAANSSALPNISWDLGESYAGLLPISDDPSEIRKLFFWFFPSTNPAPTKEIVIWLNGGPGCTSMEGLMTENGPISWYPGMSQPLQNPFTWLKLTNVVWIDQPIGVGYSEGDPDIYDENDLAREFVGFWKNFIKLFCMEGWKVYLTGESYAGVYVSYIANAFIDAGDISYYSLAGVALNSATLGNGDLQMNTPLPAYVEQWIDLLDFNITFMNDLAYRADKCGLNEYMSQQLTFPPPNRSFSGYNYGDDAWDEQNCNIFDDIAAAARYTNPCFNWNYIVDVCPFPSQRALGTLPPQNPGGPDTAITSTPPQPAWFDQPAVRAALNVPPGNTTWAQCNTNGVFLNKTTGQPMPGDAYSVMPAQTDMLSRIIEYTGNVIIGSGGWDMLIPTNGTLLVLQNVTWNGKQGFQTRPDLNIFYSPYFYSPYPALQSIAGVVGTWGSERGLTFYEVSGAGHELPRYAPGPSFRVMELLLGRIGSLSQGGGFTA